MTVKVVVFDCFGVLVTSARNALAQKYPQFMEKIDDAAHQSDYGMLTRQQFIESLADVIGLSDEEMDSLYSGFSVRDENAINWVRELKQSGKYKIGMLSNVGPGFIDQFFSKSEQVELFDEVVLSYNEGIAKPEAAIFELTARKLGAQMSECVMIDDTALNIEACTSIGMQGIRYISLDQAKHDLDQLLRSDRA